MKTTTLRSSIRNLTLILTAGLLVGCWTQNDTISIRDDGSVEFTSEVTVTEKNFSAEDVEKVSSEFMKQIQETGWKIDRKIHTTKPPYRMTFTGSGNLEKVADNSNFYVLKKVSNQEFKIRFVPAEGQEGKSSRSIKFSKSLLASNAEITDSTGKPVSKIDNVNEKDVYTIKLAVTNTVGNKSIMGSSSFKLLVLAIIGVAIFTAFRRRKRTPAAT